MRYVAAITLIGVLGCGSGGAPSAGDRSARDRTAGYRAGGPAVACVRAWGEARYAPYGYDHIVHLASSCEGAARCEVSTDVDPSPISVQVAPSEHVEVVTRRRSPAQRFEPRAVCYAFEG